MVISVKIKHYETIEGKEELSVQMPDDSLFEELLDKLKEIAPEVFPAEDALYMINGRFARSDTVLKDGNSVIVLPPVMGG